MATVDLSHRIHVSPSNSHSDSGPRDSWTVSVGGENEGEYSGPDARGRAVESALRLAEELRTSGTVLIVVDALDDADKVTRVVRSRLAS